MTNWTGLGTNELGVDRIATSPTAVALYDNVLAVAEGAVGAPKIQTAALADASVNAIKIASGAVITTKIAADAVNQSKIASGAVGRDELKTASGTVTFVNALPNGIATQNFVLPGGEYGFYPMVRRDTGDDDGRIDARISVNLDTGAFVTNIALTNTGTDVADLIAKQRYVQSSPPFDLGDGDVRGFIFVLKRSGITTAVYAADVPPWAYNGPTDIVPSRIDGRTGRRWRRAPAAALLVGQVRRGELPPEALRAGLPVGAEEEITQEVKNADMALIPHPFLSAQPGDQILLLDPMDPLVSMVLDAGQDGMELVTTGTIKEGNEPLRRAGPPGVTQVGISI